MRGWEWWRSIGCPRTVCAPMVDQSECAFRELVYRYGCDLAYSPMLLAAELLKEEYWRQYVEYDIGRSRCVVQLGCGDPDVAVKAAQLIERYCLDAVAIDLNLGCPQATAKRGHFGSFLSQREACIIVRRMSQVLKRLVVTVKIRSQESPAETARYARELVQNGACCVAIHARNQRQKSRGLADWRHVTATVTALRLLAPVFCNGNVRARDDVDAALAATGAAGIMVAEALLALPTLFLRPSLILSVRTISLEYLDICQHSPSVPVTWIRAHLLTLLLAADHSLAADLAARLFKVSALAQFIEIIKESVPPELLCAAPVRRDLLTDHSLRIHKSIRNQASTERHRTKRTSAQNASTFVSKKKQRISKSPALIALAPSSPSPPAIISSTKDK